VAPTKIGEGEIEQFQSGFLADITERAAQAVEGVYRIKNIMGRLNTFTRTAEVERSRFDLRRSIHAAVAMAQNEIKYRAQLIQSLDDVPDVWGLEGRLSQVFLNLLVNAAQSIDEGDVENNRITIRTWVDNESVFVEVADTGRGIAGEDQDRIWEPFFTTKGGRGTGIGLMICKNIIQEFGGDLGMKSELGVGTRFLIRLPKAPPCEPVAESLDTPPAKEPAAENVTNVSRGRILLIDDENMVLKILQRVLSPDHEVVIARSGAEGQAILKQGEVFDVILCDLMMPAMTGMDLHAWFVEQDPAMAKRMVFMTGGVFTPKAMDYLTAVGNSTLEKPFVVDRLRQLVSEMVGAAKADS
jgi:two-component system, cell cycle sensor histidine kinase and response regulator CckA